MEMTELDWAWAAGLFEGEGSIAISKKPGNSWSVTLAMGMTDLDVVERFQRVVGVGKISLVNRSGHKTLYNWRITRRVEVNRILESLLPYLGSRRTERAKEALSTPSQYQWGVGPRSGESAAYRSRKKRKENGK